jgi:hypothetical protein
MQVGTKGRGIERPSGLVIRREMNKKDGGKVVIRRRITFLSSFGVALALILINLALSLWVVYPPLAVSPQKQPLVRSAIN